MSLTFEQFALLIQAKAQQMSKGALYEVDVDGAEVWSLYLSSFTAGSDPLYSSRTSHDCSACRRFIRKLGKVVAIQGNALTTIWDIDCGDDPIYGPVVKALAAFVKHFPIKDQYIARDSTVGEGTGVGFDKEGNPTLFTHLQVTLPSNHVRQDSRNRQLKLSETRDNHTVLKKGLTKITPNALTTVRHMITTNTLYRGAQYASTLSQFYVLFDMYHSLTNDSEKELYLWEWASSKPQSICRVANSSIGVLLEDLSDGMETERAVHKFQTQIVGASTYMRSTTTYTATQATRAIDTIRELGYEDSLPRRLATVEDLTLADILWGNTDHLKSVPDVVLNALLAGAAKSKSAAPSKNTKKVAIAEFISDYLPKCTALEVYLAANLKPNLVSITTSAVKDSPSMFKWNTPFAWSYTGGATDSLAARVQKAGGRTDGELRFSIMWNDSQENRDDLDAHCKCPGDHIYFRQKQGAYGNLDVDIINPTQGVPAVENITFPKLSRMPDGPYVFYIHRYSNARGKGGVKAEIAFGGKSHYFYVPNYTSEVKIATVIKSGNSFTLETTLPYTDTSPETDFWGLASDAYHSVKLVMRSPNFWEAVEHPSGNEHILFMMDMLTTESPAGFYPEFLRPELHDHRKALESMGSLMAVKELDIKNQLSGLGFSTTIRKEVPMRLTTQDGKKQNLTIVI